MSFRALALAFSAVILTMIAGPQSRALAEQLVKLAEKEVALKDGMATIDVSGAKGSFRAIRVYNQGEPIEISNVRVVYGDSSFHNETRPILLLARERTRPIDPRPANKFVDTVVLTYRAVPNSTAYAKIQIWGEQDKKGAAETRQAKQPVVASNPAALEPAKPSPPVPASASAEPKKPIETSKFTVKGRCVGEGNLLLGKANVGFGVDRDMVRVSGRFGLFDRIRLCVDGNDIDLVEITASFSDGSKYTLPYAGLIKAGHRTQGMGLKGDHFIERIDLSYKKKSVVATASVEVWGELSDRWLNEESRLHNDGWVKLGTGQTAGFVGFDLDKFDVPKFTKGFSEVRVVVKNRDITLDYVTVTYDDGKTQRFEANRTRVEPEKNFGPLKLEGGKRLIKQVEARYRSRFFDRAAKGQESAVVEFWAK